MLTGSTLSMDAFENLHAVWKWPSNHRKTISAFLMFLLPGQMDFTVLLDTVPLPLNHLMWWRWSGSLICSSDWIFLTSLSSRKPPKQTTTPKNHHPTQKAPHAQRAWAHTVWHRQQGQKCSCLTFAKRKVWPLLWLKPFCLALHWSKAGSFSGWGWKKAIRKFLLLNHDPLDKNNLAISHAWEEKSFQPVETNRDFLNQTQKNLTLSGISCV